MNIYERRDQDVLDCVSPYVYGIEQVSAVPCDVTGGACAWIGRFRPELYNVGPNVTYLWTTTLGSIWESDDQDIVEIHVVSLYPELFDLTVTIDDPDSSGPTSGSTCTIEVETTVVNRRMIEWE